MIASVHHPIVKELVRIREEKKYREEKQSVLIAGFKLIDELSEIVRPKRLFLENPDDASIFPRCPECIRVSSSVLKKITGLVSPEPFIAEFPLPPPSSLETGGPILVLDAIQDPGNSGTLLRTALALGFGGVFLLPGCVDPFNEKVLRSSRAALFRFPWQSGSFKELLELQAKRKCEIYIADTEGKALSALEDKDNFMLVLGNEGGGPNKTLDKYGKKITIPMHGAMESINVAVAGAILMYNLTTR